MKDKPKTDEEQIKALIQIANGVPVKLVKDKNDCCWYFEKKHDKKIRMY